MAAMGPELALVEPFVGYGKIVTLAPKNKEAADNLRALVAATAMPPGPEFVSVLAPADPKVLVVVEIRKTPCRVSGFYDQAADQLSAAPAVELFGDARQWARPTKFVNPKVGVFMRQRARNGADLGALRDAQAAAYSRQMTLEDPGCATCAILSDGPEGDALRIFELFETQDHFDAHAASPWHDEAEQAAVPLVASIDCDEVRGVTHQQGAKIAPAVKDRPVKGARNPANF